MALQVIGAGTGRTGTMSLKLALEQLGYGRCYHMVELLQHPEDVVHWERANRGEPVDWDTLFAGYRATVDYPGYLHYKTLMQRYPNAKVILTVRDPDAWYESALATIYRAEPGLAQKLKMGLALPFSPKLRKLLRVFRLSDEVWAKEFEGRFEDKDFAVARFERRTTKRSSALCPPTNFSSMRSSRGGDLFASSWRCPYPTRPFPALTTDRRFRRSRGGDCGPYSGMTSLSGEVAQNRSSHERTPATRCSGCSFGSSRHVVSLLREATVERCSNLSCYGRC